MYTCISQFISHVVCLETKTVIFINPFSATNIYLITLQFGLGVGAFTTYTAHTLMYEHMVSCCDHINSESNLTLSFLPIKTIYYINIEILQTIREVFDLKVSNA